MLLLVRVLLVSAVFFYCPGQVSSYSAESLERRIGPDVLLMRLDKLLDVCIANYEDLTTDLLLGVAIANGQLKSILTRSSISNRPFIETLQEKCNYVESRIDSIFFFPSGANAIVSKVLINSNFWEMTYDGDERPLEYLREHVGYSQTNRHRRSNDRRTLRDYLRVLDSGAPSELQSDQCLSELLVNDSENEFNLTLSPSGKRHANHAKALRVSHACTAAMSVRVKSYGYRLTHKLLFYIILGRQQFSNVEPDFVSSIKNRLCAQILREAQLIAGLGYPEILRDLFMEQVFLCAYAGNGEFRNQTWISEIVGWQNTNGCFKYYNDFDESESNQLVKVCSTHMTGLGAAVLGLFARLQY
ncbi:UPF0764 protein C16orf89 homolog [Topomyia yanbarensis]|uniref:UPF0764 protein C16orf89 homolog n=1 Tax=Topomyia yanbarensis TaxID=2498891 RepID=UPI00273AB9D6|nr:UPF0764 protein C16orf89 homolog [Topomyia yanbarensis]